MGSGWLQWCIGGVPLVSGEDWGGPTGRPAQRVPAEYAHGRCCTAVPDPGESCGVTLSTRPCPLPAWAYRSTGVGRRTQADEVPESTELRGCTAWQSIKYKHGLLPGIFHVLSTYEISSPL